MEWIDVEIGDVHRGDEVELTLRKPLQGTIRGIVDSNQDNWISFETAPEWGFSLYVKNVDSAKLIKAALPPEPTCVGAIVEVDGELYCRARDDVLACWANQSSWGHIVWRSWEQLCAFGTPRIDYKGPPPKHRCPGDNRRFRKV